MPFPHRPSLTVLHSDCFRAGRREELLNRISANTPMLQIPSRMQGPRLDEQELKSRVKCQPQREMTKQKWRVCANHKRHPVLVIGSETVTGSPPSSCRLGPPRRTYTPGAGSTEPRSQPAAALRKQSAGLLAEQRVLSVQLTQNIHLSPLPASQQNNPPDAVGPNGEAEARGRQQ